MSNPTQSPASMPGKSVSPKQASITINSDRLQRLQQRIALINISIPTLGTVIAIASLKYIGLEPVIVVLSLIFYTIVFLGMTIGLHRYLAHKGFETSRFMHGVWLILGSMAAQGPPINWVAVHRRHHQYSDRADDPHSPHIDQGKPLSWLYGLWHSHMGWMLTGKMTNSTTFAKDMLRDPLTVRINQLYSWWILLGLLLPMLLGGLLTSSWLGAIQGLLWAGLVRMFLVHHFTWSISSICHNYGSRPYNNHDYSFNNPWVALPNFGEAWHNNHHAFPNSPILGLEWWQVDIGGWVVKAMKILGIAWNLKVPSQSLITSRKSN